MKNSTDTLKSCQIDDDTCKNESQGQCYHCLRSMCRVHFLQHLQLLENKTRSELNILADKLNELSFIFNNISISSNVIEKPFEQLEKWRIDAYKTIDQIVEDKRHEINNKIEEYRTEFSKNNDGQIQILNKSKTLINELFKSVTASNRQINDIQQSINEIEKYLQLIETHEIQFINPLPFCYVNIYTGLFNSRSISNEDLPNFKVTYIRLNGTIRHYHVKTRKHGLMSDLINNFIRKYDVLEALARVDTNSKNITEHQPKKDFILPIQVYNHRSHMQYDNNTQLVTITDKDVIVFYETPFSMDEKKPTRVLIPCSFQYLHSKISFGYPICLNLPRYECKGHHILDALNNVLGNFFPIDPNASHNQYKAILLITNNDQSHEIQRLLDESLEDSMDFNSVHASVLVRMDQRIVAVYEKHIADNQISE